jgi:glucokinase
LPAALQKGDAAAQRILNELMQDLAFALSHAVHLFHPQVVVLGGGLSLIGEPLRAGVQSSLEKFTMDAFRPGPNLALAALGEDAVPVGALELASTRSPGSAGVSPANSLIAEVHNASEAPALPD